MASLNTYRVTLQAAGTVGLGAGQPFTVGWKACNRATAEAQAKLDNERRTGTALVVVSCTCVRQGMGAKR